jgi:CO/xanthine dehydrogenase FAD-binding subunit
MDLNTVAHIVRPRPFVPGNAIDFSEGDGWLAGGTWLFSEPQPHLRRLIDLHALGWRPLVQSDQGLRIASTCTVAELRAFSAPTDWIATSLIEQCCRSFASSFKIWNTATVGGNICMSLPAGPMISLVVGLEGICTVLRRDGSEYRAAIEDFVTGNHLNVMGPGDLLMHIDLPASALRKRPSFRRMSFTHHGRSTALLIGTLELHDGTFMLTVSAATERPYRLKFAALPTAAELRARLTCDIPKYFDDVHGTPEYRKHITFHFAEEIRREFSTREAK